MHVVAEMHVLRVLHAVPVVSELCTRTSPSVASGAMLGAGTRLSDRCAQRTHTFVRFLTLVRLPRISILKDRSDVARACHIRDGAASPSERAHGELEAKRRRPSAQRRRQGGAVGFRTRQSPPACARAVIARPEPYPGSREQE
jgi:hypothetical protein